MIRWQPALTIVVLALLSQTAFAQEKFSAWLEKARQIEASDDDTELKKLLRLKTLPTNVIAEHVVIDLVPNGNGGAELTSETPFGMHVETTFAARHLVTIAEWNKGDLLAFVTTVTVEGVGDYWIGDLPDDPAKITRRPAPAPAEPQSLVRAVPEEEVKELIKAAMMLESSIERDKALAEIRENCRVYRRRKLDKVEPGDEATVLRFKPKGDPWAGTPDLDNEATVTGELARQAAKWKQWDTVSWPCRLEFDSWNLRYRCKSADLPVLHEEDKGPDLPTDLPRHSRAFSSWFNGWSRADTAGDDAARNRSLAEGRQKWWLVDGEVVTQAEHNFRVLIKERWARTVLEDATVRVEVDDSRVYADAGFKPGTRVKVWMTVADTSGWDGGLSLRYRLAGK